MLDVTYLLKFQKPCPHQTCLGTTLKGHIYLLLLPNGCMVEFYFFVTLTYKKNILNS